MKSYLQRIDTQTPGNRNDVTPVFADAESFAQLIDDLAEPFLDTPLDCIACIDALGFILGTALARRLGVGIIPVRKGGKLPVKTDGKSFRDYSGQVKRLEIRRDILPDQARVLLVDEWIETGAQILSAAELIESQGGKIIGIATISMDFNSETARIRRKYAVHHVWEI
jgi:adenine phosphoribosyltransferase